MNVARLRGKPPPRVSLRLQVSSIKVPPCYDNGILAIHFSGQTMMSCPDFDECRRGNVAP